MASEVILQDRKIPSRISVFILSIVMILATLGVVLINKNSEETLRANTISLYEGFQQTEINNTVATFNRIKDTLVAERFPNTPNLYERMLVGHATYSKIGEDGTTLLLDKDFNYLYKTNNPDGVSRSTSFVDLAQNSALYQIDPKQGFRTCLTDMQQKKGEGACIVLNNGDVEHYYWHIIPSLGSTVNGKIYYYVLGFKENDALVRYEQIHAVNQISLVVETTLLVVSLFISMWAITTLNYYHKQLLK